MKNSELNTLGKALVRVGQLQGTKFSYAVAKNLKLIREEQTLLGELPIVREFENNLKELNEKKMKISEKHAEKDDKGEIVKDENGNYKFKSISKVIKETEELQKQHRAENLSCYEEYEKLVEAEANIELHKVKLENVPEGITAEQMEAILPIIEE